jgi:hypothetical protein
MFDINTYGTAVSLTPLIFNMSSGLREAISEKR